MTLSDRLDHLPERKRRELQDAARILFEEFEAAQKGKLSDKRKGGRILKLILFGSHARGDWVDDHTTGYHSDYDLLVVVDNEWFTDPHDFWERAEERLLRELTVTGRPGRAARRLASRAARRTTSVRGSGARSAP